MLGGVVVVAGIAYGTIWSLACAAALAWVSGTVATRIVSNELAQSRRDAARDRAEQARAYTDHGRRRAEWHDARASQLIASHGQQAGAAAVLRRQLGTARTEAAENARRFRAESHRAAALAQTVDTLRGDLERRETQLDELTAALDELTTELTTGLTARLAERDDMLASWDGSTTEDRTAEVEAAENGTTEQAAAVVDLLAWEQRGTGPGAERRGRRHA